MLGDKKSAGRKSVPVENHGRKSTDNKKGNQDVIAFLVERAVELIHTINSRLPASLPALSLLLVAQR